MAIRPERSHVLQAGLLEIARPAKESGMIPFFGTLLGLVRDGGAIEGDDDLDFICPLDQVKTNAERLALAYDGQIRFGGFLDSSPYVATIRLAPAGKPITFDIFGYLEDGEHLVLPANWFNIEGSNKHHLKLPSKLLFPLTEVNISGGQFLFPCSPEETLAFLYGPKWQQPLSKGVHYSTKLIDGVPSVVYHKKTRILVGLLYKRMLGLTRFRIGRFAFKVFAPLRRLRDSKLGQ